jgi:ketosteroid isomerase-like protein
MHASISRAAATLLLAVPIAALSGRSVGAQPGAADVEAVEAANRAFYAAASACDLARMAAVWAHEPYVRVIHPTNQRVDAGWEAMRASWRDLFEAFAGISVTMPEPHMRVGDEIAWVTAEEQFRGRRNSGEEVSATLLGTSVFENTDGKWLMVHHHVSVPPRPRR